MTLTIAKRTGLRRATGGAGLRVAAASIFKERLLAQRQRVGSPGPHHFWGTAHRRVSVDHR